jgi:hypothetical protein
VNVIPFQEKNYPCDICIYALVYCIIPSQTNSEIYKVFEPDLANFITSYLLQEINKMIGKTISPYKLFCNMIFIQIPVSRRKIESLLSEKSG